MAAWMDHALVTPVPKEQPCVILPWGLDHHGALSSTGGGYRVPLFGLANKDMKSITFVVANTTGPATVDGVSFPRAGGLWLRRSPPIRTIRPPTTATRYTPTTPDIR